jgi:hypothetical protein
MPLWMSSRWRVRFGGWGRDDLVDLAGDVALQVSDLPITGDLVESVSRPAVFLRSVSVFSQLVLLSTGGFGRRHPGARPECQRLRARGPRRGNPGSAGRRPRSAAAGEGLLDGPWLGAPGVRLPGPRWSHWPSLLTAAQGVDVASLAMQTRLRHLGRSRPARCRGRRCRYRGGRQRACEDSAGVRSSPWCWPGRASCVWVNWPISVQGATCGTHVPLLTAVLARRADTTAVIGTAGQAIAHGIRISADRRAARAPELHPPCAAGSVPSARTTTGPHQVRRGRGVSVVDPQSPTSQARACPHPHSGPPHPGQASSPAARSVPARSRTRDPDHRGVVSARCTSVVCHVPA